MKWLRLKVLDNILVMEPTNHSGFGSNLDQFSFKQKCNFFLIISKARVMLKSLVYYFARPV